MSRESDKQQGPREKKPVGPEIPGLYEKQPPLQKEDDVRVVGPTSLAEEAIWPYIVQQIVKRVGFTRAGVYVYNPDENRLEHRCEIKEKKLRVPEEGEDILRIPEGRRRGEEIILPLNTDEDIEEGGGSTWVAKETLEHRRPEMLYVGNVNEDFRTKHGYTEARECAWVGITDRGGNLKAVLWADNRDNIDIDKRLLDNFRGVGELSGLLMEVVDLRKNEERMNQTVLAALSAATIASQSRGKQETLKSIFDGGRRILANQLGMEEGRIRGDVRIRRADEMHNVIDQHLDYGSEAENKRVEAYIDHVRASGEASPEAKRILKTEQTLHETDVAVIPVDTVMKIIDGEELSPEEKSRYGQKELRGYAGAVRRWRNQGLVDDVGMRGHTVVNIPLQWEDKVGSLRMLVPGQVTRDQLPDIEAMRMLISTSRTAVRQADERVARERLIEILRRHSSALAHFFRNTVGAIGAFAKLMRNTDDPDKTGEYAEKIYSETERGEEIAARFDLFAAVFTGETKVNRAEVGVKDVVEGVAGKYDGVKVDVPESLRMFTDRELLATAVDEMVANAAATKAGVGVKAREEEGNIELKIIDRGPGIGEDIRDRVLDRVPFMVRGAEHMGMGVAIATRIVEKYLGGKLDIRTGDHGTEVTFRLPTKKKLNQDEVGDMIVSSRVLGNIPEGSKEVAVDVASGEYSSSDAGRIGEALKNNLQPLIQTVMKSGGMAMDIYSGEKKLRLRLNAGPETLEILTDREDCDMEELNDAFRGREDVEVVDMEELRGVRVKLN